MPKTPGRSRANRSVPGIPALPRITNIFPTLLVLLAPTAPAQILALKEAAKFRPTALTALRPPTDDACRALALSFEDAVRRGAREECLALFDHAALLERASRGVPATEKVKKLFREGGARPGAPTPAS